MKRRDLLRSFITLPVFGFFAQRFHVKYSKELKIADQSESKIWNAFDHHVSINSSKMSSKGDKIRIGIVGYGMRGPQILRALGYTDNDWIKKTMDPSGRPNKLQESFFMQEDLNIEICGICDTYSLRAEKAAAVAYSKNRSANAKPQGKPIIYSTYRDMLEDDNIDAIIIMTPDHWHARMAIDAASLGKHVYLEKPMCQTVEEAKMLKRVVIDNGIVLQVGHQNRQQASHIRAMEIIHNGMLGKISGVETFTNRNNDHGAWIRGIDPAANKSNVNWKEFLGHKAWREFDPDRYFNWQKWFEYGTGPAGNQFSHEYDCVNQILELGIPGKTVAFGGNYFYNDSRDIPDVFNALFMYPERGLNLTYDCSLKNSKLRNKTILGEAGTMEVNIGVSVYPDTGTKESREKYNDGAPIYAFHPRTGQVDAYTSATTKYYEERGFGYTFDRGRRIDATHLHIKEWLYCIRNNKKPSCGIQQGFEETVTFNMANLSYLENRIVEWDTENERII